MRKPQSASPRIKKSWLRHLRGIFYAICAALVIRVFVIEPYRIPSESMYPSILKGDMLMANKFVYGIYVPILNWKIPGFIDPSAGDIVLFQSPSYESPGKWKEIVNFFTFGIFNLDNNNQNPRYFIKRAVGGPGDSLTLVDPRKNHFAFQVMRNGKEEELALSDKTPSYGEYTFYREKGNPALIQYQKERDSIFQTVDNNVVDALYVPKKHDKLMFVLISDSGTSKEMAREAKSTGAALDFSNDAKIKLIVERSDNKSHRPLFDGMISGRIMDIYYYSQRPNSLLKPEDVDTLFIQGRVQVQAPDDYYFMLGDNRDNSEDSRYWGFVPYRYIIGSPIIRYWPFSRFGAVNSK